MRITASQDDEPGVTNTLAPAFACSRAGCVLPTLPCLKAVTRLRSDELSAVLLMKRRNRKRALNVRGSLGRKAEAADACAHFLFERSRHGDAVVPLELVASADERVDRRPDVGGRLGHADRAQQAVEELR